MSRKNWVCRVYGPDWNADMDYAYLSLSDKAVEQIRAEITLVEEFDAKMRKLGSNTGVISLHSYEVEYFSICHEVESPELESALDTGGWVAVEGLKVPKENFQRTDGEYIEFIVLSGKTEFQWTARPKHCNFSVSTPFNSMDELLNMEPVICVGTPKNE